MTIIQNSMIGGGTVARGFTKGTEWLKPGTKLTREELLELPRPNLQALVDTGKIELFPPVPGMLGMGELHLISRGFGKYDLIEGRLINEEPIMLSKEEAETFVEKYIAEHAAEAKLPGEEAPAAEPEPAAPN